MVQRIMVAVVCIPLIFLVFFGLPPICIPIMFSLLSMVALHEVLWSTGFVKHARISGYSIVFAGLVPFWVYFGSQEKPFLCGVLCYVTLVFVEALVSHYSVTPGSAMRLPFLEGCFSASTSWRRSSPPKRRWRAR